MVILALSGKKGSGKTTAAKYLVDKYKFIRMPLAKKIKIIAKEEFNVVHPKDGSPDSRQIVVKPEDVLDKLYLYVDISKGVNLDDEKLRLASIKIAWYVNQYHTFEDERQRIETARKVYQLIGTEFFRTIDESIWIDYLITDIENSSKDNGKFVIDDLRFPNEFQKLKERFSDEFYLCSIESKRRDEFILENVNDDHASESYFELIKQNADINLENDYTKDFFIRLDKFIQSNLSNALI